MYLIFLDFGNVRVINCGQQQHHAASMSTIYTMDMKSRARVWICCMKFCGFYPIAIEGLV